MEKTIRLLHTMEEPPVIFVGGAVVTPEYAKQMNADYYAKDAHQSVEITRKEMCIRDRCSSAPRRSSR